MIYEHYSVGGELYHSAKGNEWSKHKYIDKVKTKTGKWRYIYKNTKREFVKNKPEKEYVKNPNADEDYLNSYQYEKTIDENGDIVFVSTGRKTRHYVKPSDYLADNIRKERDEFLEDLKNRKKTKKKEKNSK